MWHLSSFVSKYPVVSFVSIAMNAGCAGVKVQITFLYKIVRKLREIHLSVQINCLNLGIACSMSDVMSSMRKCDCMSTLIAGNQK